ncbi:MAG: hypothetical protein L6V93_17990 [Clostridiales bacterium]|nr:MAG: hypothetical protein L6V93_17990 [Clostridiales bacterium]
MYNKDGGKTSYQKEERRVLIGIIIAVLLILLVGITKNKRQIYARICHGVFFSIVLLLLSLMLYITKNDGLPLFFRLSL